MVRKSWKYCTCGARLGVAAMCEVVSTVESGTNLEVCCERFVDNIEWVLAPGRGISAL